MIIGRLVFKEAEWQICFGTKWAQLTETEFQIAKILAEETKENRSVSLKELNERIHKMALPDGENGQKKFSAHLSHIRKKMQAIGVPGAIPLMKGGYRFNIDPPDAPPAALQEYLLINTSEILGIIDAKGEISYVTRAVENILGYTQETFIGKSFLGFDHILSEHGRELVAAMLADRPRFVQMVYQLKHADGHWIWTEVRIQWMRPDDPTDLSYVFCIRDVDAWMRLTNGKTPDDIIDPPPDKQ